MNTLRTYINYGTLLSFFVGGLICNFLQVINYVLFKYTCTLLFREINHFLLYLHWALTVAIADWNSNMTFRFYYKDDKAFKDFNTMPGLSIGNHRYDIDWLATWVLCDRVGTLGSDKPMLKAALRYVPIFGWGASMSDHIILSRNWAQDQKTLEKTIDIIMTYRKSYSLGFFEGTRFTKAKHETSLKFAEERNLPIKLKHHLVPRTRGFNSMIRRVIEYMKNHPEKKYGFYSLQYAVDNDDNSKATMGALLSGAKTTVHIYVDSMKFSEVPLDSEQATSNHLFKIYEEKDRVMDYFMKHNKFPGLEVKQPRKLYTLINWIFWQVFTYTLVIYHYYTCFTSGNVYYITFMSSLAIATVVGIRVLMNSTKVSKSSSYGTKVTSSGDKSD